MFPYRSLLRLLVVFSFICCFLLSTFLALSSLLSQTDYYTDTASFDKAVFYGSNLLSGEPFYADDGRSFSSRSLKELQYAQLLALTSAEDITTISKLYFRNLTIQWARELLPPPKPLYDIQCLDYLDTNYDVTVSVVIPYHNEVTYLLLRTLTVLVHRTLPKYLTEILLIDDRSDVNITDEVSKYTAEHRMPVRFVHNEKKLGIAASRMKGIKLAGGDVIVFLDSHMEVGEVWLEPLLHTLTLSPEGVAVPLIHMVSEGDYQWASRRVVDPYVVQPRNSIGVIQLAYPVLSKDHQKWARFRTPSVMGGALAGLRSTLLKYYPIALLGNSWSVENNRLAFRLWMCGGGAWVSPCSQVMHPNGLDENLNRYFGDGNGDFYYKLLLEQLAELINFIPYDNEKDVEIAKITNYEPWQKEIWDMSDEIRAVFNPDNHNCKNFTWYKEQVMYDHISWQWDEFEYVGQVRSVYREKSCIEVTQLRVALYACRQRPPFLNDNHVVGFTKNSMVRCGDADNKCWDTASYEENTEIKLFGCHVRSAVAGEPYDSQRFVYNDETFQIEHPPSGRCVEYKDTSHVVLMKCKDIPQQQWEIELSDWF